MSLINSTVSQLNEALRNRDQDTFLITLEMLIAATGSAKAVSAALGLQPGELYDLLRSSEVTWKDVSDALGVCGFNFVETGGSFLRGVL